MTYIKINGTLYPAEIHGMMVNPNWGNRESKSIKLTMSPSEVISLMPDGILWSIVEQEQISTLGEDGEPVTVMEEQEYDNRVFSMSGNITDHRDGTVTIEMGKPTDLEEILTSILC